MSKLPPKSRQRFGNRMLSGRLLLHSCATKRRALKCLQCYAIVNKRCLLQCYTPLFHKSNFFVRLCAFTNLVDKTADGAEFARCFLNDVDEYGMYLAWTTVICTQHTDKASIADEFKLEDAAIKMYCHL